MFLPCLHARDARLLGRCGPEGQFCARLSVAIPQDQLLAEVDVPVVCTTNALIQRRTTVEVPQLQFLFIVVNIPVGAQRQLPMVSLQRPLRFFCCSILTKCSTSRCAGPQFHGCSRGEDSRAPLVFDADVEKTVEISQLQFVGLLVTCLSLCNDRCPGWLRQCRNCGCSAVSIVSWTG